MSEWLIDEDPELLGATLSLLVSWDTQQDAQQLSSSRSTSSDDAHESQVSNEPTVDALAVVPTTKKPRATAKSAATNTARPRRINATRERRKEEIELLRGMSAQLQGQLCALQKRREDQLRPHYSGGAIQSTAPIWETLARRQFLSRKRSEKYNAKLRGKVAEQTLVAEGLMHAIQVAMQRQTLQDKRLNVRLPIDVSQRLSEEQQLQRLEQNHAKWHWVLSLSPKFAQGELQFMDFDVAKADGWTATLDLCTSYVLPYAVDRVGDLLWSVFQAESSGNDTDDQEIDKYVHEHKTADDLIIAVFSMDSTMGGASARQGTISGKWVCKQSSTHGCDERLISQVWQYELTGFGNELDGISAVEDSWLRVVDAKEIGHTQFINKPVAVLQHVRRCHITFNRSERVDHVHIKAVTDMFKKAIKGELKYAQQTMEDTLMTQALSVKLENNA